MASVCTMQNKGCELPQKMIRCTPHLNVGPMRCGNIPSVNEFSSVPVDLMEIRENSISVLSVGREFDVVNRLFEVEVMEHSPSTEVDKERSTL